MELVTGTVEAYVAYPALLLGVTGVSTVLCSGGVKRVKTREVNMGE